MSATNWSSMSSTTTLAHLACALLIAWNRQTLDTNLLRVFLDNLVTCQYLAAALVRMEWAITPGLHLIKLYFLWCCNGINSWINVIKGEGKAKLECFECHPNESICFVFWSIVWLHNSKLSLAFLSKTNCQKHGKAWIDTRSSLADKKSTLKQHAVTLISLFARKVSGLRLLHLIVFTSKSMESVCW